jgi:uncharacterized protein
MKFLVLAAVLFIAYLVWRHNRLEDRDAGRGTPGKPAPPGAPQAMVSCTVCGLHLPQPDAVRGADGRFYCSNEHRLRAGG